MIILLTTSRETTHLQTRFRNQNKKKKIVHLFPPLTSLVPSTSNVEVHCHKLGREDSQTIIKISRKLWRKTSL